MHLKLPCAFALLAQVWLAGMVAAQDAAPAAPLSTNAPPVQAAPIQAAPVLPPDDPLLKALAQKPAPESLSPRTPFYYLLNEADITVQKDGSSRALLRRAVYAVNPDLALNSELSAIALRYDGSSEKVKLAFARIIDADGKPHDLDLGQVRDKAYYAMGDATWDEHLLTLTLPKLKPGEVLDYQEVRETKARVPGHFEYRCALGSDRLTVIAESMALHFPAELGVTKTAVRCDVPIAETKSADGIVTWKIEHSVIAKSADTLYVPNAAESWRGYVFSTPWTWDAMATWYRSQSAGQDTLPPEAIAEVTQDKLAYPDAAGLAFTLYRWVVMSIRTFNIDFNASSDTPHSVEQTLRSHCGDAKDQALLLQALLRQAGIPSSLVLLRKGYGGCIEGDQATRLQFDHCLVAAQIDGKDCYLDPTADATELGWLPLADCNVQALKISDDKGELITLPLYQPREKADFVDQQTEVHADGSAVTTSQYQFEGELATKFKSLFARIPLDKAREGFAIMFKHGNETLTDFSMNDPRQPGDTFGITCVTSAPHFATVTFNSMSFKLAEKGALTNWVSLLDKGRTDDFRFYPSDPTVRHYEVKLPPGTALLSKPDNVHVVTAFINFSQLSSLGDGTLEMDTSYATNDALVPASRVGKVRDTFQQIEDHQEASFIVSTGGIVVLPEKTALPPTLIPKAAKVPVIAPAEIPAPPRAPGSLPPID